MIEEAINNVWSKAQEAKLPVFTKLPGDPEHVQHILHTDGRVERVVNTPGNRLVNVDSLADFQRLITEPLDPDIVEYPLVTYDQDGAVFIPNTRDSRERFVLPLQYSSEHKFMQQRVEKPLISVKELRAALRIDLRLAVEDEELEAQISRLSFTATSTSDEQRGKGRESLSGSVIKSVQDESVLPAGEQLFNVRMFSRFDADWRYPINCILEPDMESRQWFLRPIEESWEQYRWRAVEHLGNRIRAAIDKAKTEVVVARGYFEQRGVE